MHWDIVLQHLRAHHDILGKILGDTPAHHEQPALPAADFNFREFAEILNAID